MLVRCLSRIVSTTALTVATAALAIVPRITDALPLNPKKPAVTASLPVRRLYSTGDDNWSWQTTISDHEAIGTRLHGSDTDYYRVDLATGKARPLPGLDGRFRPWIHDNLAVSPDGRFAVWRTSENQFFVASLDERGSVQQIKAYGDPHDLLYWLPDNCHWMVIHDSDPDDKQRTGSVKVFDRLHPGHPQSFPLLPGFGPGDHVTPRGTLASYLHNSHDPDIVLQRDARTVTLEEASLFAPSRIVRHVTIPIPAGEHFYTVSASPDERHLLWVFDEDNDQQAMIRQTSYPQRFTLWISSPEGSSWVRLGKQHWVSDTLGAGWANANWSPDGRSLRFAAKGYWWKAVLPPNLP